ADVGGVLFFTARDGGHGTELWKSDGTDAGTALVKDINLHGDAFTPASVGFSFPPQELSNDVVDVNGTAFFVANDGTDGWELWKSDGTETGTTHVKDINPGVEDSFPSFLCCDLGRGRPLAFAAVINGALLFVASDPGHGLELWRTDGTEAGTVL